jgi:hypothetical protein
MAKDRAISGTIMTDSIEDHEADLLIGVLLRQGATQDQTGIHRSTLNILKTHHWLKECDQ